MPRRRTHPARLEPKWLRVTTASHVHASLLGGGTASPYQGSLSLYIYIYHSPSFSLSPSVSFHFLSRSSLALSVGLLGGVGRRISNGLSTHLPFRPTPHHPFQCLGWTVWMIDRITCACSKCLGPPPGGAGRPGGLGGGDDSGKSGWDDNDGGDDPDLRWSWLKKGYILGLFLGFYLYFKFFKHALGGHV